jgi:4'-phosphopantetheinyl transferase EntD
VTGLADLLPRAVVSHATSFLDETGMTPEEADYIAAAVPRRRAEFATVRRLARRGMRELGLHGEATILPGPSRAPLWPHGIVGSLTHCAGFAGAAVARSSRIVGIGIDAEPAVPLPPDAADIVLRREEREWLAEREPNWSAAVFSAKESVYKTWHPSTGRWLDFHDAVIRPIDGGFEAALSSPPPGFPATLRGRWALRHGIWLSALAIEAE